MYSNFHARFNPVILASILLSLCLSHLPVCISLSLKLYPHIHDGSDLSVKHVGAYGNLNNVNECCMLYSYVPPLSYLRAKTSTFSGSSSSFLSEREKYLTWISLESNFHQFIIISLPFKCVFIFSYEELLLAGFLGK